MKRLLVAIISLSALVLSTNAQEEFKKYPFKSGIIEYKWEGTSTGTEVLYFDNYGYKEARLTKTVTKMMGMTMESNTLTIMDGAVQYAINLEDNTGTKIDNAYLAEVEDDDDYEEIAEMMIESLNYKKIGQETVAGKTCDVYEGLGKIWIWKGMMLKSETNNMGIDAKITATSIKTDVAVPADKFKLPEGVKITENPMNMYMGE